MKNRNVFMLLAVAASFVIASCSTTKDIPDDDQLFVGLTKITYDDQEKSDHLSKTKEEVEAALATAPNGALFGSSYYRSPFPYSLLIWNWADGSSGKFKQWMKKTFGKPPVLMSQVNPALRASVAQSVLRKNGYMRGTVSYNEVPQRNPKKMKIGYNVVMGPLFTVDSMSYNNFPEQMQQLIDSTLSEAYVKPGSPFSVSSLDAERNRLSQLMRNNGYYFYQPGYASYLADTFALEKHVRMRLQLADSLPPQALKPWHIGKTTIQMRKSFRDQFSDSLDLRFLKIRFSGKKPPMRPSVVLRNMRLRPRSLFSNDNYQESMQNVNSTGVFSSVDFRFTPRTTTLADSFPPRQILTDTLDLTLNCVLDQPYDFYFEAGLKNRTIGRRGPEAKVGVVRRNAFRGGEKLDINLHGAYEWQTGGGSSGNSYQYGVDVSLEFPRILLPFRRDEQRRRTRGSTRGRRGRTRRNYSTPWTIAKLSTDIVHRPDYYKMHIVSGEWTYKWQPSATSRHELSPLTVKYQYMNSGSERMASLLSNNVYLLTSMDDRFIPKMRYTYVYTSDKNRHNPLRWETSIEESGNLTSLYFLAKGEGWNTKNKTLFKTPYSQFVRIETDLTKTWMLDSKSQLVGHVNAGFMRHFGNSSELPFSEKFYVGGSNSVRAFAVRTLGPGGFPGFDGDNQLAYVISNGDMKLVLNLEYRRQIVGNLYGAFFLDAGNVWDSTRWLILDEEIIAELPEFQAWNDTMEQAEFKMSRLFKQIATGTGIGLRYDLDFLVVRLDWGFGLHLPYDTGKSGYFNISRFKDMHTLHFAIGYPF